VLHIAGIVQDQRYFCEEVEPHIDGKRVIYLGAVSADQRSAVLGNAYALLHPIGFDEPFGFSVVEALSCGTPVVAFDRGSMRELIHHGENGFLAADMDGAATKIAQVSELDRAAIRSDAIRRFDRSVMVDRYVEVYREMLRA
jgi:glycosyltransferase involved in cell wall biosynthesis